MKVMIIVLIFYTILSGQNNSIFGFSFPTSTEPNFGFSEDTEVRKKIIDPNNINDAEVTEIMQKNNLTPEGLAAMQKQLRKNAKNQQQTTMSPIQSPTIGSEQTSQREAIESIIVDEIKTKLTNIRGDTEIYDGQIHEYTFPPYCRGLPRYFKQLKDKEGFQKWFSSDLSWNIYFTPKLYQFKLIKAYIRIFKNQPDDDDNDSENNSENNSETTERYKNCDATLEDFITVKLSVYVLKKNEKEISKKEIGMEKVSKNAVGWIEFNASVLAGYWAKGKVNNGVVIEVYDSNDKQLDPKKIFEVQRCEAGKQLPWGIVGEKPINGIKGCAHDNNTYKEMFPLDSSEKEERGPRFDIESYRPKTLNLNSQQSRRARHIKHRHRTHAHRPHQQD